MSPSPASHTQTTSSSSSTPSRASSFFAFRSRPSVGSSPPNKLQRASTQSPPQLRSSPQRPVSQAQPQTALPPPPPQPQQPQQQQPPHHPQSNVQEPSPTYDPPLHPEIRSIVSLTMAHTQKIYYSGPLLYKLDRTPDGQKPSKEVGWRDIWAQLYGTTLSIWDMGEVKVANEQGKEVPPSYVNVTEAVCLTFNLHYLCHSSNTILVCQCPRRYNPARNCDFPPSEIHQCHNPQHCWDKSTLALLPNFSGPRLVGCRLPALMLGKVTSRGDLYSPPHSYNLERRQEYPIHPDPW